MAEAKYERLAKLNRILEEQKAFLYRVPDPDTRERAEGHLHTLIEMRDQIACECSGEGRDVRSAGPH